MLIADLPPLAPGTAAIRIAELFETLVLVVRAGGVDTQQIQEATSLLTQKPFVILNGTRSALPSWLRKIWPDGP